MSIMRVPAIPAPGAGYAVPGNRGFTGWRATAYGRLGAGPTDPAVLQQLAAAASWQVPGPTPGSKRGRTERTSTVPVPTSGGTPVAPVPSEQAPVAAVADGNGGTGTAPMPTTCGPCTAFKLGALLVVAFALYKVAT